MEMSKELDKMMVVVDSKGWIILVTSLSLIFLGILWAFLGKIPIQVSGLAMSITKEGQYVVVAQAEGTVIDILVEEGQHVKKGDTLVKIVNPEASLEIQQQKDRIAGMQNSLKNLTAIVAEENRARQDSIRKKIESAEFALANAESKIPYLKKDLESKRKLQGQGIISLPEVEKANSALMQTQNEIESSKATISSLKTDLILEYRTAELRAKKNDIAGAQTTLARMILRSDFLAIKTERGGILIEMLVSRGKQVKAGQLIATIEPPLIKDERMEFYATVNGNYGVLLNIGLPVQIEVAGVDPKQFGYLMGYITYVSPYPVSREEIISYVTNPQVADFIKGGQGAVYGVIVNLIPDASTYSGFKWTSKKGPPVTITTGTLGMINVIVQEKRPIYYILPEEISPYFENLLPKDAFKKSFPQEKSEGQ